MMDINTVTAGGGTIAGVNSLGEIEVGPQNAGAMPGPACYGRGERPTITDCNLALGYLSADNFLGGRMRLDAERARTAIATEVAGPLGMPIAQAAEGVIRIIDVKMEEAIKAISTMRGHDLRDFMLLAFGGAGPLHAGRIARDLGMAGVIVPLYPGVFSAIGLLMSDVKHDYIQSRMTDISELTSDAVEAMFAPLIHEAVADLHRDGFDAARIGIDRSLDMRYAAKATKLRSLATKRCTPTALRVAPVPRHGGRCSATWRRPTGRGRILSAVRNRAKSAPPMPKFAGRVKLSDALREYRRCGSTAKASPARSISASVSTSGWRCKALPSSISSTARRSSAGARPRGSMSGRT
jgi:N-methylhydantoinase A